MHDLACVRAGSTHRTHRIGMDQCISSVWGPFKQTAGNYTLGNEHKHMVEREHSQYTFCRPSARCRGVVRVVHTRFQYPAHDSCLSQTRNFFLWKGDTISIAVRHEGFHKLVKVIIMSTS